MTLETPQDSNKKFVKQDWNRAKKTTESAHLHSTDDHQRLTWIWS